MCFASRFIVQIGCSFAGGATPPLRCLRNFSAFVWDCIVRPPKNIPRFFVRPMVAPTTLFHLKVEKIRYGHTLPVSFAKLFFLRRKAKNKKPHQAVEVSLALRNTLPVSFAKLFFLRRKAKNKKPHQAVEVSLALRNTLPVSFAKLFFSRRKAKNKKPRQAVGEIPSYAVITVISYPFLLPSFSFRKEKRQRKAAKTPRKIGAFLLGMRYVNEFREQNRKALVKNGYHSICKKREGRESRESENAQAGARLFCEDAFFAALGAVDIIRIYRVTANRFCIIVIIFNVIFHMWPPNFTLWGDL